MHTQKLAEFVSQLKYDDVPPACIETVKKSLIDSVGCAASGGSAPWAQAVFSMVKDMGGQPDSSIWFTGVRGPLAMVPMVTATMIHSYWFDDVHGAKVHPGAVVIPAVLAVSEAVEGVSGRDVLTALVAGDECLARVAMASDPVKMRLLGWQPSTMCGSFGAAAGAAKVLGLGTQQVCEALGLAAGLAAGTYAFSVDGSPVGMVQMGSAAQRGVMSALLAQKNSWNSNYGLDAEDGGFCRLFSDGSKLDYLTNNLGNVFEMQNISMKNLSVCGSLLSYVEAAIDLANEHEINPSKIRKLKVGVARVVELQCGHPYRQLGTIHAQENLRYCIAVAIFERSFTVNHLTPDWLNNSEIINFIPKIETYLDSEIDAVYPGKFSARIKAEMDDGSIHISYVETPTGSRQRPLTRERLEEKFYEQVEGIISKQQGKEIINLIDHLEDIEDISSLTKLIS